MTDIEEKHIRRSVLVTDIAIGMSDGLAVPFALATGLSVVTDSTSVILLAGLVAIMAGSVSMGVGGYYATKSEIEDHNSELRQEHQQSLLMQDKSKDEIKAFFANLGMPEEIQHQAAEEVLRDKEQWSEISQEYGVISTEPAKKQAFKSALNIGIAYIVGGFIPLAPYVFYTRPAHALPIALVTSIIALFIFGWLKNKLTGANAWTGALRSSTIGTLAAGAAFIVAHFFKD